ncbi:unnamed protein product, partial [Allacma fusca]
QTILSNKINNYPHIPDIRIYNQRPMKSFPLRTIYLLTRAQNPHRFGVKKCRMCCLNVVSSVFM